MPQPTVERLATESNVTVAVATGKNHDLEQSIRASAIDGVVPIPFTDKMPALIQAVDGVVVNSGGMTALESLASGTPVIFHHPQSGHGIDSARALHADGYATYAPTANDLIAVARSLNARYAGREQLGDASMVQRIDQRADAARQSYAQERSLTDVVAEYVEESL
jgi:UDP-N-acetylglucosamine:LPS N-acetylglucosamine transferase